MEPAYYITAPHAITRLAGTLRPPVLRLSGRHSLELASVQLRASELYAEDDNACHLHGEDLLQQAIYRLSFLLVRMQSEENPLKVRSFNFARLEQSTRRACGSLLQNLHPSQVV